MNRRKLWLCRIMAAVIAFSCFTFPAFAEEDESEVVTALPEFSSNLSLPSQVRGTILTPGTDFCAQTEYDEDSVSEELDAIYSRLTEIGLNTVIIRTVGKDGKVFFSADLNKTDKTDYILLALEKAKEYNFYVFLELNLSYIPIQNDNTIDSLVSASHVFTLKYLCDGILLSGYYLKKTPDSYSDYMKNGSGIGYENWLYDTAEYYLSTVSNVIRKTDNSVAVGLLLEDMWANESQNELGSATSDSVSALYDGYSDTKSYIEKGYADFAALNLYGSLTDTSVPFETCLAWWNDICIAAKIPLYAIHFNEKIGTDATGWYAEDQLLKQLTIAKEYKGYGGSIFHSFSTLLKNPLNTTTTLIAYYNNDINEESLFEDLEMITPKRLNFTTYDHTVEFMGTFDQNFDVYLDGKKIELNEAGNFYLVEQLAIGQNTFKITHKGKTVTYKIERKIEPIQSIDNSIASGKTLNVDGGTAITLSAIAYKGAQVIVSINGKNITLKQSDSLLEDSTLNNSYANFTGQYIVPDGIIGKEQPLGKISVTASYAGYVRTMEGASITVNAKPEPIKNDLSSELFDQSTAGTGEVVGIMEALRSENEAVKLVYVNQNYTHVLDPNTTGEIPNPLFTPLPKGTVDYLYSRSGDYYITENNKRFRASDVTIMDGYGLGKNALYVTSVGTSGGDAFIKMRLEDKTGFNIQLIGNNYYTAYDGDYNINALTATYVSIVFDNITSVTKLPSFDSNLVFSSGIWDTVTVNGIPKFRMLLKLRQPGVYMGHGSFYNESGELVIFFPVLRNTLSGMNIVIDPGHGYGNVPDRFDPGAIGHIVEQEAVLAISKKLATELSNMGANVTRLQTESTFYLTKLRPVYARGYGCDIYLSIHANKSATNSEARGTEVYYFTSFSQPLAQSISASVSSYFTNYVYSDGANKNRGAKYSYYWVTLEQDFPSVLVELGFVSNLQDAMALANDSHQQGIAKAIAMGVYNYVSRSAIS